MDKTWHQKILFKVENTQQYVIYLTQNIQQTVTNALKI